jgi:predicted TIM-barrel fold metal-dependent hydrolase
MRLDAYTHFIPKKFYDQVLTQGNHRDIGKRMLGVPSIFDLDVRRKHVGMFPDYAQILSYPQPPLEVMSQNPQQVEDYARMINDGFAELCARHPDEFPGFVAQAPMGAADVGVRETERAMKDLGALGVQIFTNVRGKPLDRPEFEPFFAAMAKSGTPIWMHPARGASFADYPDEKKSLYEIWWAFGWSYETGAAMARLVFSKMLDKYPDLKIIVHHFGGIVPMLEGRIGPGWDQLGARTSDEDYGALRKSLKKRPLDYFKQDFYADTAAFTSRGATVLGLDFYPLDKIVFASDCPFDPEKGTMYIRETLKILDSLEMSKEARDKIYFKNLEALTGKKLVK